MQDTDTPFWETKTLAEMDSTEWESLCDGCALCCMHKVEDEDTGALFYTNLACKLLELDSCRCSDYANRLRKVEDCLDLATDKTASFDWMPASCAYRLLANGEPLPAWHPLVSGDPGSVHAAGISVRGKVVSERDTGEWTFLWNVSDMEGD